MQGRKTQASGSEEEMYNLRLDKGYMLWEGRTGYCRAPWETMGNHAGWDDGALVDNPGELTVRISSRTGPQEREEEKNSV